VKIGVTGGIAAGKSHVCRILGELGAYVIDADAIGHSLLQGPVVERLTELFGGSFVDPEGRVNRRELGRIVFSSARSLASFNSIIKPLILKRLKRRLEYHSRRKKVVVVDAALIFEWGVESWFHKIVVVTAPDDQRLERLVRFFGLSPEEARRRIKSQWSQDDKAALADYIIQNDSSLSDLRRKVVDIWPALVTP